MNKELDIKFTKWLKARADAGLPCRISNEDLDELFGEMEADIEHGTPVDIALERGIASRTWR